MKSIKKIALGVGTFLTTAYWTVAPALAAPALSTLCPENSSDNGALFSKLCLEQNTKSSTVIRTSINVLLFVAFVAALIFLIIGGIRWILSGGDKDATANAKKNVTSALVGLVIVLAAWILINVVVTFFGLGNVNTLELPVLIKG